MSDVINIFFLVLFLVCWILIIKRYIPIKKPTVTVKATVCDKYKSTPVSHHPATGTEKYVVVFKTKMKKLSFVVSEYSYNHYTKNQKGTLKYKGSTLISFD